MPKKTPRSDIYRGLTHPDFLLYPSNKWKEQRWRELLYSRDNGICGLCKKPMSLYSELQVDHIMPRSMGGSDDWDNCRMTHKRCNLSRGNRYWEDDGKIFNTAPGRVGWH